MKNSALQAKKCVRGYGRTGPRRAGGVGSALALATWKMSRLAQRDWPGTEQMQNKEREMKNLEKGNYFWPPG